jgi:plastocyanin
MTARLSSRSNAPARLALSLVVAWLGAAACFSDRSTSSVTPSDAVCTAPTSTAGSTIVFIRSFVFDPASVRVKAGGSVAWVNCEPTAIPHTATSDDGVWDSGSFEPNAAFVRTFPSAGTFPYFCTIHPGMKATVIVE